MSHRSATRLVAGRLDRQIAARKGVNCSRFVRSGRFPVVASKRRSNVMTQRAQNGAPRTSIQPEVESSLEEILEEIQGEAPPPDDDTEVDTGAATAPGAVPTFMRLPSQGHSVTRLG